MSEEFDVIVVGAGVAGSSAAIAAASKGLSVLMVERGDEPGSKNTSGAMLLAQVLEELVPDFWKEAPLQRPIEHHRVMMMSEKKSFTIDFADENFTQAPFNGFSVLRKEFDSWLSKKACESGAILVTNVVVEDLIIENEKICGIRAQKGAGEARAKVVILADGVNSLLIDKAGLVSKPIHKHDYSLGIKELISLDHDVINERFGLVGNSGAAYATLGDFNRDIPGGAFVYTNYDTISLGIVLSPAALIEQKITADDVLEKFKAKKEIKRLLEGGRIVEYSAHMIGEGGLSAMPSISGNGVLVAGDAAGFVVNTGLTLMGMNLAISSGMCAGKAAASVIKSQSLSKTSLCEAYTRELESSAAMSAMKVHRRAPDLMRSPHMYGEYTDLINNVMESIFMVGPGTKRSARAILKDAMVNINKKDLLRDAFTGVRAL
ncbi:FAD-dependent oxidoreductase [Eggerthella sp. YY7918]|uniref:FAD-dependent oxidoreductase n=1 Tax=Eggerthella sp. (strain YY7918) TaxID=502558 RepID=UPI0002171602|nr:FAD-dependent oxidoreductase [Eggerthella sp. YY7918]BAK44962.1 dehydrogenase [Eggerthella sp. YY7918]